MTKTVRSSRRWTADSINFLTQEETRRLFDVIDSKRDYAIFLLAYRHGLRASEVAMLHADDLHALKHSIATHLLDDGADLRFVQDWIGHASIGNTVICAQLTSRRRNEEARKVFTTPYVV
jgi:site-specific recombinase XerD